MRYISFEHAGRARVGERRGDAVLPLAGIGAIDATTDTPALAAARRERPIPLGEVRLLPVSSPSKVIGVGRNYPSPDGDPSPDAYPILFPKFAQSLLAAGEELRLPAGAQADYEGEIAAVIGRAGRCVHAEHALDHVLGYALANDISLRGHQRRSSQWLQGKAWDRSTPVGPEIITPDEFDAGTARLRTLVNGEPVQDGAFRDLIHPVPRLIALISEFTELLPGDLILTGSPHGSGQSFDPPRYLRDGDEIRVEVRPFAPLDTRVALRG